MTLSVELKRTWRRRKIVRFRYLMALEDIDDDACTDKQLVDMSLEDLDELIKYVVQKRNDEEEDRGIEEDVEDRHLGC